MDARTIGYVARLVVLSMLAIWFASIGWTITTAFLLGIMFLNL